MINDMINIKNFGPWLLETNKLLFKDVFVVNIFYIKYIAIKSLDHVNINNEDFLYLILNNVDGYIKENNEIKYLDIISTNENKEALKKYTEL